jgi:hypothetical protein
MISIPLSILLSLVVAVIIIGSLFLILGSPKCDALANTTVYQLKTHIDEVAQNNFYSWDNGGVPPDEETSYYTTAPIMLCQDKGISYLETLLGTTLEPQYKIYYEMFPEGGGGLWTEAYPWGGGAAATLRMWAFFRIGTGVFEMAAKYLTHGGELLYLTKKLASVGKALKEYFTETELDEVAKIAEETGEHILDPLAKKDTARLFVTELKIGEAAKNVEEGVQEGVYVKLVNGEAAISNGRLIISETKRDLLIPVERFENGVLKTDLVPVYAKIENGEITEIITLDKYAKASDPVLAATLDGYEPLKVSPADVYKEYLDTIPESERDIYKSIYVTESDAGGIVESIKGKITESGFYNEYFKPTTDRLIKFVKSIETAGYRTEITMIMPEEVNGMKLGVIKALDDPDVANMLLRQSDFKDMVAKALGKSSEEIDATYVKEFLNGFKLNGMVFIPDGSDFEVFSSSIKTIVDATKNNELNLIADESEVFYNSLGGRIVPHDLTSPLTPDNIAGVIVGEAAGDPEKYKIIQDMAKTLDISEDDAAKRAYSYVYNQIFPEYKNELTLNTINSAGMYSNSIDEYLKELAQKYNSGDENAAVQLANFLGFVEQNKGTLPASIRTPAGMAADYFKKQGKKMVYLDGPQNIVNPDSFYARAFFASLGTAGCEGNSICLYSYSAMSESPQYLIKDAQKYFVRVWRPVSIVEQWAGFQAALQHVPENPRFYVVSPCIATAKIWKTTYNGEPTIFVYPEKVDVEDSASNYCYADSNLINSYVGIWAASDAATIITTVVPFLGIPEEASKLIGKVIGIGDPITLAQGVAEGVISWPGWPFKTLTWEQISANSGKMGIKEIQKGGQTK